MSPKTIIQVLGICSAWAAHGPSLRAQATHEGDTMVVSLAEARTLAAGGNPELRAASWGPAAARGDLRSAGTLSFNPDIAFEARSPGTGLASRYEAQLGLELEVAGQRGLRVRASEAFYAATRSRFEDEGRNVLADVERAYHRLVSAEQRLALAQEIDALSARLQAAVGIQLAEGEVSVLEANLASIESARARARALEAGSARTAAASELGRLLGLDPAVAIRTAGVPAGAGVGPPTPALDELLATALAERPDLRALEREMEGARQEERLARRTSLPSLRVAALATREDPLRDPRFGMAVGIELPLFNRNQGLGVRRRAEISEVAASRRALELRVRTDVENALLTYTTAEREVEILEVEMLGPIRQNQSLLEVAYREGKIDLASLLLLRNQLLDAELSYWAAWERREIARTDLESATGEILRGVDFIEGDER